jgi:hypothetical protein
MTRLILLLLIIVNVQLAVSQVEPALNSPKRIGEIFKLDIKMSFHGRLQFTFVRGLGGASVILKGKVLKFDDKGNAFEPILLEEIVKLSDKQEEDILTLLNASLKNYSLDDTGGVDGSNWCLGLDGYATKVKLCFWNPSSDAEARGLVELDLLGRYLANLHNVKVY